MKFWKNFLIKMFFLNIIYISCDGQVVTIKDIRTFDPIPFVNIYINEEIGETTNVNGELNIKKYPYKKELNISCVGYKSRKITKKEIEEKNFVVFLKPKEIKNVIISTSKRAKKENEIAYSVEALGVDEIKQTNKSQTPEIINNFNGVSIQKSQLGGGSPIIRGLEANRILLVCDGVRLNNAIYRSGHLQNSLSVDPHIIESMEVVFGPSSTLYGSDALGGVISFYTKTPEFSKNNKLFTQNNIYSSFSSAENGFSFHFDNSVGGKNIANVFSVTYSVFGDAKMGKKRTHGYSEWGLVNNIIEGDIMTENPDPNIQVGTGYNQLDFLNKTIFKIKNNSVLKFNSQFSTSSNIPRYDNLQDYDEGLLKWAEWSYGPQTRVFNSIGFNNYKKCFFYDNIKTSLTYQFLEEDRITRKYLNENYNNTYVDVHVYNANVDLIKSDFLYGIEYLHNNVFSVATENTQPRYPSGGSVMSTIAFYGSFEKKIKKNIFFNIGSRFSSSKVDLSFNESDPVFVVKNIKKTNKSLTGNASLLFAPNETNKFSFVASRGFRSPNVDDFGKVFIKRDNIVLPNPELEPEYVYSFEFNFNKKINDFLFKASTYNNKLQNLITKQNINSTIIYDGDTLNAQRLENSPKSYIKGFSFSCSYNLNKKTNAGFSFNNQKGFDVSRNEHLGHIPPFYGKLFINFKFKKTFMFFWSDFAFKKDINEANSASDNSDLATVEGWPKWQTFNFNLSYKLNNKTNIQCSLENITDLHYITFASGISSLGRNLKLSISTSF